MPSLCLHLSLARDAFSHLGEGGGELRGHYLFGATLPDIHLIAGYTRQHTHFVDVFREQGGAEIERFFQAHPHLAQSDTSTRSLVGGYLSHLVSDKAWIERIYRPYFGPASPLAQDPLANLLDRTLQYELDRREREDRVGVAAMVGEIGLISWKEGALLFDERSFMAWKGFVIDSALREPTWDRFPLFARHYLAAQGKVEPHTVEEFLATLPQRVEWVLKYVSPQEIASFRQEATEASVEAAQEHLRWR